MTSTKTDAGPAGSDTPPGAWLDAGNVNLARERTALSWVRGVVIAALLLATTLFAIMAWRDRVAVLDQAEQNVLSTVTTFEEHARNVFETHRLIGNLVNEHIRGMSWTEISASEPLHQYLAAITSDHPQVQSVWLIDAAGQIRSSSAAFPAPRVSVADRDYFVALRERDRGAFIGRLVAGRVFKESIFNVALRRSGGSEDFDGVIVVSALPSYFTDFWKKLDRRDGAFGGLVRRDGAILARDPPVNVDVLPLGDANPMMRAIAQEKFGLNRDVAALDGIERIWSVQKVMGFPVYVSHGVSAPGVLRIWYDHLLVYCGFFVVGILALGLLGFLALRKTRGEIVVRQRWRLTAQQLEEESERRGAIEKELSQAQKMEAIGSLTGGMAHDFNNILGVIILNLGVAQTLLAGQDRVRKLVVDALTAARSGADLIRGLLAFARRQPLKPARINVNEQVSSMHRLLSRMLGEDIEITLILAPGLWPVIADPSQVEACIMNLATNARDAMPKGGKLTITTANRTLDAGYAKLNPSVTPGDYAMIAISDTGVGMAPEVAAKVFEPFFTTKELGKGTGLGLSMVFGFANQSGGHVSVQSEPGMGATFRLFLPRATEPTDAAGPAVPVRPMDVEKGRGETVLVVEDNAAMRQSVVQQLVLLNYRTVETDSARAALTVLQTENVALVFSDIVLPGGMDGFELAEQVRARWPSVMVLLTSGFAGDPISRQPDRLKSPPRLLSKPFDLEQLARSVHDALRG